MKSELGNLGNDYTVRQSYNEVEIQDRGAEFVSLSAIQALSLLQWLSEHKAELEALAKEQA